MNIDVEDANGNGAKRDVVERKWWSAARQRKVEAKGTRIMATKESASPKGRKGGAESDCARRARKN